MLPEVHLRSLAAIAFPFLAILYSPAHGHHAADFFTLEGFDTGHQGDGYLNSSFDWEKYGGIDELSATAGVFYSPLPRLGFGVDLRTAEDPAGDWVYSSLTPKAVIQLSDPHKDSQFKFAVSVSYQFAEDLSQEETITSVEEITTFVDEPVFTSSQPSPTDPEVPACNPLFDLDCTPTDAAAREPRHTGTHSTTTSSSSTSTRVVGTTRKAVTERIETKTTTRTRGHKGIHNHDSRQWMTRMVMQTEIGKTKIIANLIGAFPEDDQAYWGYSIGAKRRVFDHLALSVEGIGDLSPDSDREHTIITGAHIDVNARSTVKVGAGFGLSENSPDFTLRAGLIWRF